MSTGGSCREELIHAVRSIVKMKDQPHFTVKEVVDYMYENKTIYRESTIRTHITSKCCSNAPNHHATVYNDFERIGRGLYRLATR